MGGEKGLVGSDPRWTLDSQLNRNQDRQIDMRQGTQGEASFAPAASCSFSTVFCGIEQRTCVLIITISFGSVHS